MVEGRRLDRARDGGVGQDRLDLGREPEDAAMATKINGLDADPVARHRQHVPGRVPDGESEHAVEAFQQTVDPPFPVAVNEDLGVGMIGAKSVTGVFQLAPERKMVVDLAVEGDPNGTVRVGHGLGGSIGKVDNGEPAVGEADATVLGFPASLSVWSPVRHAVAHGLHGRDKTPVSPGGVHEHQAGYAAHGSFPG